MLEKTGERALTRIAPVAALVMMTSMVGGCSSGKSGVDIAGVWVPDQAAIDRYVPGVDPGEAAIEFIDGRTWDGRNGCIDVGGEYTIDGDAFAAASVGGAPAIDCVPGSVPYLRLLVEAQTVALTGEALEFHGDGGELILRMVSAGADAE